MNISAEKDHPTFYRLSQGIEPPGLHKAGLLFLASLKVALFFTVELLEHGTVENADIDQLGYEGSIQESMLGFDDPTSQELGEGAKFGAKNFKKRVASSLRGKR